LPSEDCPPIATLVMTPSVPFAFLSLLVLGLQNTTTFFVSPTQAHFFHPSSSSSSYSYSSSYFWPLVFTKLLVCSDTIMKMLCLG
jgi:hypothetical protein